MITIALGGGVSALVFITTYLLFGARMTARQRTWLPASTALVGDRDEPADASIGTNEAAARA